MKSIHALLLGLAAGISPFLLFAVAVHFTMGIDQAIESVREGGLSYISATVFVLVVCTLSGTKVYVGVTAIKTAMQFELK